MRLFWLFPLLCLWAGCSASDPNNAVAVQKGRDLYLSYGCGVCHGSSGDGQGISAKNFDPKPTNFHNVKAYTHGNSIENIRRTIRFGIKDEKTAMPAFDHIPEEELGQIAAYLASLQQKQ